MLVKNRFSREVIEEFDISPKANLKRANLSGAILSGADLRWANLSEANLSEVNLSRADLSDANLSGAILSGANLSGAILRWANLSGANLSGAILSGAILNGASLNGASLNRANLSDANLRWANLNGANLSEANLPSPTMILLADWKDVSAELCVELMRYDAANHPDPKSFDEWANGGDCPYDNIKWQRCANFKENRQLWSPGQSKSALELAIMLLKEKCIWEKDGL